MFRIRQVSNSISIMDRGAIQQVVNLMKSHFPLTDIAKFDEIPEVLSNPFKYRFQLIILVADDLNGNVKGAALLYHAADLQFCYLDYIAAQKNITSRGIGGALAEFLGQVRAYFEFHCDLDNRAAGQFRQK